MATSRVWLEQTLPSSDDQSRQSTNRNPSRRLIVGNFCAVLRPSPAKEVGNFILSFALRLHGKSFIVHIINYIDTDLSWTFFETDNEITSFGVSQNMRRPESVM